MKLPLALSCAVAGLLSLTAPVHAQIMEPLTQDAALIVSRVWGWTGIRSDSLRILPSGKASYVGRGYGPRQGKWFALLPQAVTDSAIRVLGQLLLDDAAVRAATQPPGTAISCQPGSAAQFRLYPAPHSIIIGRLCYDLEGPVDSAVNRLILRPEWRLNEAQ